ncbi:DUF1353 domain-containing protein [Piscinibacter sakaiensis]|uniref:DUF1353 domain-containing protein n=1 Tax=Piscinibacter sakaiensis TaxID=1547922 RepID=UPI0009EC6486|nr:DUF1353 domain-containing protein [Piscinibacter sakaiensis]
MFRSIGLASFILVSTLSTACAADYESLKLGQLKGKLVVQWIEPDLFLFIPDATNPLVFTRSDGKSIQPGRMLTDGGSVPRPMWAFRSYSPWGYAPAFIVHDWLFHIKRCKIGDYQSWTLESSADVMGEVIKTMMETGKVERDPQTVRLMLAAVSSSFAKKYWESDLCLPLPPAFSRTPAMQYTIEF